MNKWIVSWILPLVVRYAVTAAGGYLISRGWGTNIDWSQVAAGAVATLTPVIMAVGKNTDPFKVADRLMPHIDHVIAVEAEGHSEPQV